MELKDNPLISVIILNWNRFDDTKKAIESCINQTYSNIEILLIDNASTETNSDDLPKIFPCIKYFKMEKNYGCPGGRNRGIELSKGEYLFFVDNDGILEKNAIANAFDILRNKPDVGIVAGKILSFNSVDEIIDYPSIEGQKYYTSLFKGGVTMHRKSIYDKIGVFNEDFVYGSEETNLSLRLLAKGLNIYYTDNVILWHKKAEIARNKAFNMVSSYSNKLVTYWELMPMKQCFMISFWFIFAYSFLCFKNGCGILFLKNIPKSFSRAYIARKNSNIRLTSENIKILKTLKS